MRAVKRKQLQAAGWDFGDAKDFLGLTHDEAEYLELKIDLAVGLGKLRIERGLTLTAAATLLDMSPSQVVEMEAGDPRIGVDLLMRSLLKLGATRRTLAELVQGNPPVRRN